MTSAVHEETERIPVGDVLLTADIARPPNPQGVVLFAHGSGSGRRSPRNRYVAGELHAAGMATVLVDLLTPESVNGGKYVAGTGTIDAAGKVGPIGGIQQKLTGARDNGATVFLVPADNCGSAKNSVPDGLTIAKVTTLDSAIKALELINAGKPAPTC